MSELIDSPFDRQVRRNRENSPTFETFCAAIQNREIELALEIARSGRLDPHERPGTQLLRASEENANGLTLYFNQNCIHIVAEAACADFISNSQALDLIEALVSNGFDPRAIQEDPGAISCDHGKHIAVYYRDRDDINSCVPLSVVLADKNLVDEKGTFALVETGIQSANMLEDLVECVSMGRINGAELVIKSSSFDSEASFTRNSSFYPVGSRAIHIIAQNFQGKSLSASNLHDVQRLICALKEVDPSSLDLTNSEGNSVVFATNSGCIFDLNDTLSPQFGNPRASLLDIILRSEETEDTRLRLVLCEKSSTSITSAEEYVTNYRSFLSLSQND